MAERGLANRAGETSSFMKSDCICFMVWIPSMVGGHWAQYGLECLAASNLRGFKWRLSLHGYSTGLYIKVQVVIRVSLRTSPFWE